MKVLSKVPLIKKIIALDPRNPGVISKQRYTNASGKKSKYYYSWQASRLGTKISERLPKDQALQIQDAIKAAETKTKSEDDNLISALKSYRLALSKLMERNKIAREQSGEGAIKAKDEEAPKKGDVTKLDRLISRLSSRKAKK